MHYTEQWKFISQNSKNLMATKFVPVLLPFLACEGLTFLRPVCVPTTCRQICIVASPARNWMGVENCEFKKSPVTTAYLATCYRPTRSTLTGKQVKDHCAANLWATKCQFKIRAKFYCGSNRSPIAGGV